MIEEHKDVFFKVAEAKSCWFAVRYPNVLAEQWLDKSGYVPKPHECAAKTADAPGFAYAGLVVSPRLRPEGFSDGRRKRAQEEWDQWMKKAHPGFTVEERGPARGLVKYLGRAMFSDYDLLAILPADAGGKRMPVDGADSQRLEDEVLPLLEEAFKNDCGLSYSMVQHGADFNFDEAVTWGSEETILWFGPGRRFEVGITPPANSEGKPIKN